MAAGLVVFGLGRFLAGQGLGKADQWASVISVFLTAAGLLLAVSEAIRNRQQAAASGTPSAEAGATRNTITAAQVSGPVLQGRNMQQIDLTGAGATSPAADNRRAGEQDPPGEKAGEVDSRIEGGTVGGPVIQGRDLSDLTLPPPPSPPSAPEPPPEESGR